MHGLRARQERDDAARPSSGCRIALDVLQERGLCVPGQDQPLMVGRGAGYLEHTHRRRARTGLEGHRAVAHLVGAWARRVWPLGPDPRQLSAGAVPEDCLMIDWRTGLPPVAREQLSNDFFDIPLQAQHGSGG